MKDRIVLSKVVYFRRYFLRKRVFLLSPRASSSRPLPSRQRLPPPVDPFPVDPPARVRPHEDVRGAVPPSREHDVRVHERDLQVSVLARRPRGREPEETEVLMHAAFTTELEAEHGLTPEEALIDFCLIAYNLNEFVYVD